MPPAAIHHHRVGKERPPVVGHPEHIGIRRALLAVRCDNWTPSQYVPGSRFASAIGTHARSPPELAIVRGAFE